MPSKQFTSLLSQLSRLVENLAQAHEQEIEETYQSIRSRGEHVDGNKHICTQDVQIERATPGIDEESPQNEVIAPISPVAPNTPVSKKGSLRSCDTWESQAVSLVASDVSAKLSVPNTTGLKSALASSNGQHSSLANGVDRQLSVASDPSSQSSREDINRYPTARASMGVLKHHQFGLRKPWSDHHEFDNMEVAEILHSQLLRRGKGRFSRRCSMLAEVRRSIKSAGELSIHAKTSCIQHWIIHPESRRRALWILISLIFLLFDLVMLPVDVGFNLEPTLHSRVADILTTCFWTADIAFNFLTGIRTSTHVEMEPAQIAMIYAKSYLLFDLLLVIPDWMSLIEDSFPGGPIAIFRVARFGRLLRMLRLGRLMRVFRLKPLLLQMIISFRVSSVYVQVSQGWMGLCLLYLLLIHFSACAWYALGNANNNGWVYKNHYESASALRAYIVSFQWCVSRFFGLMSSHELGTPSETLVDAVLIYVGFILAAFIIGCVTVACMTRVNSKTLSLWNRGMAYIHRHRVSTEVNIRLMKFLEALNCGGAGEVADEEASLLEALPPSLKQDLVYEARMDYLGKKPFFSDMTLLNERVVLLVANLAMSSKIYVEREVIFAYGDVCDSVLFVSSGTLWYVSRASPQDFLRASSFKVWSRWSVSSATSAVLSNKSKVKPSEKEDAADDNIDKLVKSSVVSEPVLWTTWEHCGSLLAAEESTALALDASKFAEVIDPHQGPCMHICHYAKQFVWQLNHSQKFNDLTEFTQLRIENFEKGLFDGTDEDHFIFISHYKMEAGTEATLMRDSLEPILRQDPGHQANNLHAPIFVDSEDLADLAQLKEHVRKSEALILLLTPGVLSRPWVLIEVVTAAESDVTIVPVEVQRQGSQYSYPDEEYYNLLCAGKSLNEDARQLLEHEGITLTDVSQALRQVFLKIALPFSPHKTKSVREAELTHILKRCNAGARKMTALDSMYPMTWSQASP